MVIDTFGKVQKKTKFGVRFLPWMKNFDTFLSRIKNAMSFYLVFCCYAKFDNYLNGRHVVARGLTLPHGGREYGLSQDRDITFKRKK